MDGLLESLAEDEEALKEAGLTDDEGDSGDGKEGNEDKGEHKHDTDDARKRVRSRRARRNASASSSDEDGPSQDDGGASRGSDGSASGTGEAAHEDAQASQGDDGASQGSGELLEPKDDSAWAKYRRERRELEAKVKEYEAKLAAPAAATQPAAELSKVEPERPSNSGNPEPDKEKDLAGWLIWNAEEQRAWRAEQQKQTVAQTKQTERQQLYRQAGEEIAQKYDSYKAKNSDIDNAMEHAKQAFSKSLRILDPKTSEAQINEKLAKLVFDTAVECERSGSELGEVLYDMAIERFGYQKVAATETASATHPNLRVISNNKRKSATPLEGGGQKGRATITMAQAADMSPAELMALPEEDLAFLKSQGF